MGFRSGGTEPNNILNLQATAIINFLNAHPGYDPGWDTFKLAHPDMVDLNNREQQAISASQGVTLAARTLDYYGGQWDSSRVRIPGASYAGSIQEQNDKILAIVGFGGTAAPSSGGGGGISLPGGGVITLPSGSLGNAITGPLNQLTTWARAHPIQAAGVGILALIILRRRR